MRRSVNKTILNVKPYVPGKPIEEVKRELGLKQVVKLASNENPYPPPESVLKAITKASKTINRYPDGDCFYLRQALSKHLRVKENQLIFGNGSDEIIVLAVRAFVKPDEEVVIAQPSFLIYDIASRVVGAKIKPIPLKDFHYDLGGMKKAITSKTKIVFLGNPDNPAGTYLTQKDMDSFLNGISKDVLVFIDEAYFEYVKEKDYVDSIKLIDKFKNVIVTRTFSKMYGLAGLRIGYGIADKDLIGYLNRVREPFNINAVAQAAALACMKDQKYFKSLSCKIEKERLFLYKELRRLNLNFNKSCANFICIKLNQNASLVSKKLLKKGVIIRDMGFWGMDEYIRVSIGLRSENKKFISILEDIL